MAKKMVSFLGVNNYLECNYCLGDSCIPQVRFIQEALARLHCTTWAEKDQIVIYVTADAFQKNWENDGHSGGNNEGLHSRLLKLGLPCQIKAVLIPDGKSEEEIWGIFNVVCNELAEGDEVVLDITNALRSLPMLLMVVLQYMRVLRHVSLTGIFYGAFEVLGTIENVRKMKVEKRNAPVFDLTSFVILADWSVAVDRFLAAGDATMINDLVKKQAIPVIKAGPADKRHGEAMAVKNLAKRLFDFTKTMATCRGRLVSECAGCLNRSLDDCRVADLVPPLVPLLEKIRQKTAGFTGTDEIRDGIRAAGWCLEHNLVQQAYTILQETAVSFFLMKAQDSSSRNHPLDADKRGMVTGAASLLAQKRQSAEGRYPEGCEQLWQIIWSTLQADGENFRMMSCLEQNRNDINHAGMKEGPLRADRFDAPLREALAWFEKTINA